MKKTLTITVEEKDGVTTVNREIDGFNSLELVGLLHTQINQIEAKHIQDSLKTKKNDNE